VHHTHATLHQANGPLGAAVLDADPPVGGVATRHPLNHDQGHEHAATLVVWIDGQDTDLDASELNDPSTVQDLRDAGANTAGLVDFLVADLLVWPAPDRWRLLLLVRSIGAKARIALGGHPPRADVFGAILDAMVGPENLERCQRGLDAAVDAAAAFHPEALPLACAQLAAKAKQLKVPGMTTAGLLAQARALAAGPGEGPGAGQAPIFVRVEMPDASVAEDALVPPGWSPTDEGVSRADGVANGPRPIATPLVVAARLKDVADGSEALRLAWRRDGQWHRRVVDRTVTADARGVTRLAEVGIQVTSGNAALVVDYLDAYETANRTTLPVERVSRQMGWLGPALAGGFLWGRTHLVGAGQPADVEYRGLDSGDEQAAAAFHAPGGLAKWRDSVEPLADYPRARLGLYAGLATPLLAIQGAPNFAVDFAGETSSGETTVLRAIASEWGDPDEQNPASALGTWDATRTWIERTLAARSGLPMILDDTKRARRREDVAQTLYDATSGRGRGRGTIRSTDQVLGWHTVLISSGEAPATGFTHDGGTKARVLTLWGSPFGSKDAATGAWSSGSTPTSRSAMGWPGPASSATGSTTRSAGPSGGRSIARPGRPITNGPMATRSSAGWRPILPRWSWRPGWPTRRTSCPGTTPTRSSRSGPS
jgi:hypothetical protein